MKPMSLSSETIVATGAATVATVPPEQLEVVATNLITGIVSVLVLRGLNWLFGKLK